MTDPLALLINIAKEKHIDSKWTDKPLYPIKILANSSKGDLAEAFVMQYCQALGFEVEDKTTRLGDYDLEINGKKFEVKMATEYCNFHFLGTQCKIYTDGFTEHIKPLIPIIKRSVLNDCIKNPRRLLNEVESEKRYEVKK